MSTLHLTLKKQWYDLISSGTKKEEYRELKPYWFRRFMTDYEPGCEDELCDRWKNALCFSEANQWDGLSFRRDYDRICFHLGYTSTCVTYALKGIKIGHDGQMEWGDPVDGTNCFILSLGEKISEHRQ